MSDISDTQVFHLLLRCPTIVFMKSMEYVLIILVSTCLKSKQISLSVIYQLMQLDATLYNTCHSYFLWFPVFNRTKKNYFNLKFTCSIFKYTKYKTKFTCYLNYIYAFFYFILIIRPLIFFYLFLIHVDILIQFPNHYQVALVTLLFNFVIIFQIMRLLYKYVLERAKYQQNVISTFALIRSLPQMMKDDENNILLSRVVY